MTTAVLPLGTPGLSHGTSDRAVGREARDLREMLRTAVDRHSSVVLGRRHWNLQDVRREAATQNWDGYGARAVDDATYARAEAFLDGLSIAAPDPDVAADPDGELSFTWYREPRRMFSVSISRDGRLSYAGLLGPSTVHGTEYLDDAIPEAIEANLARLFPAGT